MKTTRDKHTSNTPAEREQKVFHDLLENIWKKCIADFLGTPYFERRMFNVVVTSTEDERTARINSCYQLLNTLFEKTIDNTLPE